ncbi:trypsin-like peptidase domain-containing protein [Microaerobacter geothermalis]|uniref:trypsin-like peptidase domain-containing protein n=1 Tax=Microaerobacter geothermalis TaxID=674972 RepID=UPI001F2B2776|nr:trypsin-like peptidase domain-containing protein [Microaerobacter geothermalis]MCF6093070.1 trypsin-like peptidase domain-containing protein [Microaerobacter geothermalis]
MSYDYLNGNHEDVDVIYPEMKKNTKKFTFKALFFSFLAGLLVMSGAALALNNLDQSANTAKVEANNLNTAEAPASATQTGWMPVIRPNSIADIVEEVGPSVVKIDTYSKNTESTLNPFMNDPFFERFFGRDFGMPQQPRERRGLGSGFIISKDGYILTNEHVIDGADRIEVTVTGYDKPFQAKLIGADFDLDLAVLKIDGPKDFPVLKMGNSEDIRVGDWVIAIGNPYGLDHTVTVGVISAKGRPVDVSDRRYKNLLQTDASINPGNSGGPLLNLNGEVIGINTAVNASAQGIGFAIPTSTVENVLNDLIEKGKVVRPWLGVSIQDITPELAEYFKLNSVKGTIISDVALDSPAGRAGLKQGDVIVEFNKKPINNSQELVDAVKSTKIGESVVMVIIRDGQRQFVTVKITEK